MEDDDKQPIVTNILHCEENELFDEENILPNGNGSDSMEDAVKVNELVSMNGFSKSQNEIGGDLAADEKVKSLTNVISPEPALPDSLNNDNCNEIPAVENEEKDEIEAGEKIEVENIGLEYTNGGLESPETQDDKSLINNNADTKSQLLHFDTNDDNIVSIEKNEQEEIDSDGQEKDVDFENFGQVTVEEMKVESIGFDDFGVSEDTPTNNQAACAITEEEGTNKVSTGESDVALDYPLSLCGKGVDEKNATTENPQSMDNDFLGESSSDSPAAPVHETSSEKENPLQEPSAGITERDQLNREAEAVGNDFGDFDTAPIVIQQEESEPATASTIDDECRDLGVPTVTEPKMNEPTEIVVADDEFSEFSSDLPATSASVEEKATEEEKPRDCISLNVDDNDSEDVGDFNAVSAVTQPEPEAIQSEESEPATAKIDDDFGDFGASTAADPTINISTEAAAADFGEFSSDLPTTTASPEEEAAEVEMRENLSQDFGDFDTAPAVAQPEESKPAVAISDDEFGDFDAAQVVSVDNDDDFGDFDTPPTETLPQTSEPKREAENDEFGDFRDFNTPIESQPVDSNKDNDDDDDDFGDFGDFSEPSDSNRVVQQERQQQDPLITKAITVFAEVFSIDESNEEHDSIEDEEANKPVSLKAIMNEISSDEDFLQESEELARTKFLAAESLGKMLLPGSIPMIQESSVKVIFGKNTIHPYSQYTSLSSTENASNRSGDIKESENQQINMTISFESVESSKSNDGEDEASNKVDIRLPPEDSPPADVKLDFSDFEAPSEKDDSGTGEKCNGTGIRTGDTSCTTSFLKKIPDLSFMLNTRLVMPKR